MFNNLFNNITQNITRAATIKILKILNSGLDEDDEEDEEDEEDELELEQDELQICFCLIIVLTLGKIVPDSYSVVSSVYEPKPESQEIVKAFDSKKDLTLVAIFFSIP